MFGFLEKFFPKSLSLANNTSVLGIDIGSSAIKVVQLKKKDGKAILETYGELALGPYAGLEVGQATSLDEQKIVLALQDIMREARVTTKNCAIAIPFSASLVSVLDLPKVSERELKTMVPIEARKYIPVPIGEVMLDWWVIPNTETESENEGEPSRVNKIEVLIAAIHNDTIYKYQSIAKQLALENAVFEIELFSTLRSVLKRDMAPTMVIDVGAGSTKVSIVERGVLKASHIITRGSQDITLAISRSLGITVRQAEQMKRSYGLLGQKDDAIVRDLVQLSTEYIFGEASRIALNFERQHNKILHKVVLTGGGVLLKDFITDAKAHLETEVALATPFSAIEAPAFLNDILKEAGPEFAVALGLALRKLEELG